MIRIQDTGYGRRNTEYGIQKAEQNLDFVSRIPFTVYRPLFIVLSLFLSTSCFLFSAHAEGEEFTAQDKAQELHRLASSDVVYQDQEIKAIYYQNVQMIDLLKQIRDLLDSRLKEKTE